jgi:hypothetical protein
MPNTTFPQFSVTGTAHAKRNIIVTFVLYTYAFSDKVLAGLSNIARHKGRSLSCITGAEASYAFFYYFIPSKMTNKDLNLGLHLAYCKKMATVFKVPDTFFI